MKTTISRAWTLVTRMRNGRIVNGLAGVALAIAVLRLVFENTHELLVRGAAVGNLLQDLSIAYLAAWIFNLLVVEVPRQRDRAIVMGFGGRLVGTMTAVSRLLAIEILRAGGRPLLTDDAAITHDDLVAAATKIRPDDKAPMVFIQPDGSMMTPNWLQYLDAQRQEKERRTATVLPLLHLFDTPIVEAVLAYSDHYFWKLTALTVTSSPSNTDLTVWTEALSGAIRKEDRVTALLGPS
jgi:hypothetical protein